MPFLKTENINIPDFLIPWLTRFYEPHEINLLKLIADNPLEKEPVIRLLEQDETLKDLDPFLKRAWKRGVIQFIDNDKLIAPEDFHTRYEYWALFEGFKDIPVEIKD